MSSKISALALAFLCVAFAVLEIFLWDKPGIGIWVQCHLGTKVHDTNVWAANQGVYNLFLAAGLIWAAICRDAKFRFHLSIFFLVCIAIAGVFGWRSVNTPLFLVAQTLPAAIAMAVILYARYR